MRPRECGSLQPPTLSLYLEKVRRLGASMSRLVAYRTKAPALVQQRIGETLAATMYLVQTTGPTCYVVRPVLRWWRGQQPSYKY